MRPTNKQRSRKNNNNRRPMGNVVNRVFDSAGPEGKVRGTPQQIIEKYQTLARDAQLSGDPVASENFLQHSEHYSRMLLEAQREASERREEERSRSDEQPNVSYNDMRNNGFNGNSSYANGDGNDDTDSGSEPEQARTQSEALATFDPETGETSDGAELVETPESTAAKEPTEARPAKPRRTRAPRRRPAADDAPKSDDGAAEVATQETGAE